MKDSYDIYGEMYYKYTPYVQYIEDEFKESAFPLSIELLDFEGKPDCKVGSFYRNFWFRTNAGLKYKKYKSEKNMRREVERLLKRNGLRVVEWRNDERIW